VEEVEEEEEQEEKEKQHTQFPKGGDSCGKVISLPSLFEI
jgi:hypothetical protein